MATRHERSNSAVMSDDEEGRRLSGGTARSLMTSDGEFVMSDGEQAVEESVSEEPEEPAVDVSERDEEEEQPLPRRPRPRPLLRCRRRLRR